jgi:hypothetical protein
MMKNSKKNRVSKIKRKSRGGSCSCSAGSGLFKGGNNNNDGDCVGAVKINGGGKRKSVKKRNIKNKTKIRRMKGGVGLDYPSWNIFGNGGLAPPI